ncbi:hypothetical protein RJD24_07005 [Bacillaceae bacterium IKA-2]|nr:hypothetical protein RJD24_07005 [Bacillaceae bacterium IKA-2]
MKEQLDNQQKLMELVVGQVLRKHGVLKKKEKKASLDKGEKQKIIEIVTNIKSDVEEFLKNTKVAKTENDYPDSNGMDDARQVTERKGKKNSVIKGINDLNAVKKFL